ncbi:MAG: class I SAM-dependent methyltransferase [Desulfomonile tiedjei]|nr:class I SAM-dependent methyltransferase [Desulfomonile tiedjei]
MNLAEMKGLRFPDVYVTRFFFKTGFDRRTGNVLELGCGNGNNLMLFYHFGWNVVGIDKDRVAVQDALHNFAAESSARGSYEFVLHDLSTGLKQVSKGHFDVLLIPNSLYYLERGRAEALLADASESLRAGAYVFLRARTVRDFRYGRGQQIDKNAFLLNTEETGEKGLVNVFYHDHELVEMLQRRLALDVTTAGILHVDYQNLQQGMLISNSDVVIWGRKHGHPVSSD